MLKVTLLFICTFAIGSYGQILTHYNPPQVPQAQPLFQFSRVADTVFNNQAFPQSVPPVQKPLENSRLTRSQYQVIADQLQQRNDVRREKYEYWRSAAYSSDRLAQLNAFDEKYDTMRPKISTEKEVSFYDTAKQFGEADKFFKKDYPMLERANAINPSYVDSPFGWRVPRDEFMAATGGNKAKYFPDYHF